MKYLERTDEDYEQLRKALGNLAYLWDVANMSFTPKIHGALVHELDQMIRLKGIGDMLEDDIERRVG